MGLNVSHDCWHGAYSAFTRWRNTLAEAAGYEVKDHRYPDGSIWRGPTVVAKGDMEGTWADENFQGEWDRPPEDPLLILLVHSDCDGIIEPDHAMWLAKRLEQLLPVVAALPDDAGHIGNWQATTQRFIDGLNAAHAAGEQVEFG